MRPVFFKFIFQNRIRNEEEIFLKEEKKNIVRDDGPCQGF